MQATIYSKPDCTLCDEARTLLNRLAPEYGVSVREVNILNDPELYEAYGDKIPVVIAGDGKYGWLFAPISEAELRVYLGMAARGGAPPRRVVVYQETKLDKAMDYVSHHWLRFVCIALGIFVGLPWLAPLFAAFGLWGPADVIYTIYTFQCHQLPERSARLLGYEVAQCWRCQALYGAVLLFGILFAFARDRDPAWLRWMRKPLPWYWFVLLIAPMVMDGMTHMLGLRGTLSANTDPSFGSFLTGSQFFSLNWWLRVITGGMAGLGVAWFAIPRMARVVAESESIQQAYREAVSGQRAQVVSP